MRYVTRRYMFQRRLPRDGCIPRVTNFVVLRDQMCNLSRRTVSFNVELVPNVVHEFIMKYQLNMGVIKQNWSPRYSL